MGELQILVGTFIFTALFIQLFIKSESQLTAYIYGAIMAIGVTLIVAGVI